MPTLNFNIFDIKKSSLVITSMIYNSNLIKKIYHGCQFFILIFNGNFLQVNQ